MWVSRYDRKSLRLGWLGFVVLVLSTIGLIYLYGYIFDIGSGDSYTKALLIFASVVVTELIIFGGLLFYYIKRRKRNLKEEAFGAPNAYICPSCNAYKKIKFFVPNMSYATINCPECGTEMQVKQVDYLPKAIPKSGSCWIATAVYGDPFQLEIEILRDFRDAMMDTTKLGHNLTKLYYKTSPPIANTISDSLILRKFFKFLVIQPSVKISESILKLKQKNYIENIRVIRRILRNRYFSRYHN